MTPCLAQPNDRTEAEARIIGALPAIKFEPHNLSGGTFEGEEMPFGYFSTAPTPQPIFELRTVLDFGLLPFRATAYKLALAYNSYDAMRAALEAARHALVTSQGVYATDIEPERRAALIAKGAVIEWQIDDTKTLAQIDAALNLARGVKP